MRELRHWIQSLLLNHAWSCLDTKGKVFKLIHCVTHTDQGRVWFIIIKLPHRCVSWFGMNGRGGVTIVDTPTFFHTWWPQLYNCVVIRGECRVNIASILTQSIGSWFGFPPGWIGSSRCVGGKSDGMMYVHVPLCQHRNGGGERDRCYLL